MKEHIILTQLDKYLNREVTEFLCLVMLCIIGKGCIHPKIIFKIDMQSVNIPNLII